MDHEAYAKQWWENRNHWLYELARDERLKPTSVRIALLIGTFLVADRRETVRPGYDWLMKNAGLGSRTTLSSAIKELVATGYIVVSKNARLNQNYSMPFDGEGVWKKSM